MLVVWYERVMTLTLSDLLILAGATALYGAIATAVGFGINFILTSGGEKIRREHELKRDKDRREHELKRDKELGLNEAKRAVFAEVVGTLGLLQMKVFARIVALKTQEDIVGIADMLGEIEGTVARATFYSSDKDVQRLLTANRDKLFNLNTALLEEKTPGKVFGNEKTDKQLESMTEELIPLSKELMQAMQKELGIEAAVGV